MRLKAQIEREYTEKMAALDLVFKMAGGGKEPTTHGDGDPDDSLTKIIRKYIESEKEIFTSMDVENTLATSNIKAKRGSISNVLRKLVYTGELKIVQRGTGRAPSVYIRPEFSPNTGGTT